MKHMIAAFVIALGMSLPAKAQVSFGYDSTRVYSIRVNGFEILTGGGVYLIGSQSGNDNPTTNYSSVDSNGRVMTNGGPSFRLSFWVKGPNVLGFIAEVGPVSVLPIAEMNMAFDFHKQLFSTFAFSGNRYYLNRSTSPINYPSGSQVNYSSIPQIHKIFQNGVLLGMAGEANTKAATQWGAATGSLATIRVNVFSATRYRSMDFTNHFGTNNIALGFRTLNVGETARVEGEIVVTPRQGTNSWTFQAETDLSHQIGRREGDGWSVNVLDTPGRYITYGPYTTVITPGSRTATFRLMLDNVTADNNRILTIDVFDAATGSIRAIRNITRRQFTSAFQYQDFDLSFTASAGQRLEFRTFWHGGSYVRQDYVRVR